MAEWNALVVEDDLHSGQILSHILQHYNIDVDVAPDAEEALTRLANHEYSVAIVDLALPGMSGWELIEVIRQDNSVMPCVAVTAYYDSKVEQQAVEAGFKACFPKPVNMNFVQELAEALER